MGVVSNNASIRKLTETEIKKPNLSHLIRESSMDYDKKHFQNVADGLKKLGDKYNYKLKHRKR